MDRLISALRSFGVRGTIEGIAPTQAAECDEKAGLANSGHGVHFQDHGQEAGQPFVEAKPRLLDRALDRVTAASGSEPVFLAVVTALLVWAFLGIPYASAPLWAIMVSNVQAIFSYMFDSLLMRQQLNGYVHFVKASACLRSRAASNMRMLRQVQTNDRIGIRRHDSQDKTLLSHGDHAAEAGPPAAALELPSQTVVERVTVVVSRAMGHIIVAVLYWAGIAVWLSFGPSSGWSDQWQLYINSATSALMVFVFAFVANLRERHEGYMSRCLAAVLAADARVERRLRRLTGDSEPNATATVPPPKVGKVQRAIFFYADVVGALAGMAFLAAVVVAWVAIGPVMRFDDNWWLLIGTYAGLVGLNDAFVLMNVQAREGGYEADAFGLVGQEDAAMLACVGLEDPSKEHVEARTLSHRVSSAVGRVCAHELMTVAGVLLIVGLLVGASAMHWTETGQLLCNVPPSIIESFLMMSLITGQNLAESQRRQSFHNMLVRRTKLLAYVDGLESKDS